MKERYTKRESNGFERKRRGGLTRVLRDVHLEVREKIKRGVEKSILLLEEGGELCQGVYRVDESGKGRRKRCWLPRNDNSAHGGVCRTQKKMACKPENCEDIETAPQKATRHQKWTRRESLALCHAKSRNTKSGKGRSLETGLKIPPCAPADTENLATQEKNSLSSVRSEKKRDGRGMKS